MLSTGRVVTITARASAALFTIASVLSLRPAPSLSTFTAALSCNSWNTPFCDAAMTPLAHWNGHVFRLSQAYPAAAATDVQPWLRVDPRMQPERYLNTALAYFFQGNIREGMRENDFNPALNRTRRWFNAPFQDLGPYGREFVHGLTEERNSTPGELTPQQTDTWTNYAVGYYNVPGATVIHNVWSAWRSKPGADPNIRAAQRVPEGTVAAKLLFTTASPRQVPFIANAPAWQAYIYKDVHHYPSSPNDARAIALVRLLQIDMAVKDRRAGSTGWIFGTFIYGGGAHYEGPQLGSGWRNVAPVGLMWGNDPGYVPPSTASAHHNGLTETLLNPSVNMPHYGYQYRLNGPVDNPGSSCISCHSTGELNAKTPTAPGSAMIAPFHIPPPPAPPPSHDVAYWFRNIGPAQPFDQPDFISTGYSLQVMDGIRSFYKYVGLRPPQGHAARLQKFREAVKANKVDKPLRDGGSPH